MTGAFADRCVVGKLNKMPTNYIDAYPILTEHYDPFNPYETPALGSVLKVEFYDCDTNEQINITNSQPDDIQITLVGGNECVSFDPESESFIQHGMSVASVVEKTVFDT